MKIQFFIALSAVALIGCKNNPQEITVAEDAMANTQLAEEQRNKTNDANPFAQGTALTAPATSQGGGVTLNPPHGQPGHRCDIAVGAPLPNDGNVIAQAQNVSHPVGQGEAMPVVSNGMEQPQVIQVSQPQNYVGANGEKLNPPHGQPGHRCDIPVGAPLNSKPAAATTAAPAQQPQVVQQQVVIDPQQAQQHTGTTEPGFSGKPNPPHGQPGHRCDIAVGATLP